MALPVQGYKINADVIAADVLHAVQLSATSELYSEGVITAQKPGASATVVTVANVGLVYLLYSATTPTDMQKAKPLSPGSTVKLPAHWDLSKVWLVVATANDGVQWTVTE